MSLQNRVTPFGNIVLHNSRGLYTGNRGILHSGDTRQLHPTRRWTTKAWIYCLCDFNNRKRDVFGNNGPNGGPGWTNLFFMDEATALAAGHRPCFYCQRKRAIEFQSAFSKGNKLHSARAPEIDALLHQQRLMGRAKRTHALNGDWRALPNGTMVAAGETAYLVHNRLLHRWCFSGYQMREDALVDLELITPPATVAAIQAGFQVKR